MGSNNAKYIKKKKKKKTLQNTARFATEQTNVCVIEPPWIHIEYWQPRNEENTDNQGMKRTLVPNFLEHLVAFVAHRRLANKTFNFTL